jgi:hypothetical protein
MTSGPGGHGRIQTQESTSIISPSRRLPVSPKVCATNAFQTRSSSPREISGITTCGSRIGRSAFKERHSLQLDRVALSNLCRFPPRQSMSALNEEAVEATP